MTHYGRSLILTGLLAFPGLAIAGSYGAVGVSDATVAPPATATATVWCPKIQQEVPQELARQMECGEAVAVGVAEPKVARERFTRGFLGLPAHEPTGARPKMEDDQTPFTPVSDNGPKPDDNGPKPTDKGQPVDKWGRLDQLGVNQSNYHSQGQDFLDKVDAYRNQHGASGDWSNFKP